MTTSNLKIEICEIMLRVNLHKHGRGTNSYFGLRFHVRHGMVRLTYISNIRGVAKMKALFLFFCPCYKSLLLFFSTFY